MRHLSEGPTAAVTKSKICKGLHGDTLKSLHQFCGEKKKKMQDNVFFFYSHDSYNTVDTLAISRVVLACYIRSWSITLLSL